MVTLFLKEFTVTLSENHRKSLVQYCQRSELNSHFEWTAKMVNFGELLRT